MTTDNVGNIYTILSNLGFAYESGWCLKVGAVTIIGGASIRGFTLMFTEIGTRSASQYEVHGPVHAKQEMVAKLIRANLAMNHASSLPAWDALQVRDNQAEVAHEL